MAFNKFKPEIWSALLLVALRKSLVYSAFTNRDYEGDIAEAGDTVRITSVGRPTIANYVPGQTVISPETVADSQRTLVVDQSKFFAFQIDDVDKRQAKGGIMEQLKDEASTSHRSTRRSRRPTSSARSASPPRPPRRRTTTSSSP